MTEHSNLLRLDKHFHRGRKRLPGDLVETTGYSEGIFVVTDKTPKDGKVDCENESGGCIAAAKVFESRIIAVIDAADSEIDINNLDPAVRDIVCTANQSVKLCMFHLLEAMADDKLGDYTETKD